MARMCTRGRTTRPRTLSLSVSRRGTSLQSPAMSEGYARKQRSGNVVRKRRRASRSCIRDRGNGFACCRNCGNPRHPEEEADDNDARAEMAVLVAPWRSPLFFFVLAALLLAVDRTAMSTVCATHEKRRQGHGQDSFPRLTPDPVRSRRCAYCHSA
ncbi:hypothetical protein MRX96_018507 [Rhipicephalus microplus]